MTLVQPKIFPNTFLSDVRTYRVDPGQGIQCEIVCALDQLAATAADSGTAELVVQHSDSQEDFRAAIAVPIYRRDHVVSVAVLATEGHPDTTGVFEIWSPTGSYEELSLSKGYYGNLARFQNVSSFVRFEKGSGLPGQVWNGFRSVIHSELSKHPGFLRAAGASAGNLHTAIGIPVAGQHYRSSVLLLSSQESPIATGFEVWRADPDGFTLESADYDCDSYRIAVGSQIASTDGLPGLAAQCGGAVLCDETDLLSVGRDWATAASSDVSRPSGGLALPFFEADDLTSVTVLLF
ncbi:MAG: GAF domain-containing protein [Pirellulaceae bacterium]|nr:GAF domain-containing protein [Pirellulaceae bacterium]